MIKDTTRHIDLHLPRGWNQCTTEELETIAAGILLNMQQQDRYHPFDMTKVKVEVMMAINGLEVVAAENREPRDERQPAATATGTVAGREPSARCTHKPTQKLFINQHKN